MSFLNKVEAKLPPGLVVPTGVKKLMDTLYQTLGNKPFLRDLERILAARMSDLTPHEEETLLYLARDLKQLPTESSQPSWKKW